MFTYSVGQGLAGLDVVEHLDDDLLEDLVLGLLGQDGQALHQGQAGVDHRGELPGEDHHLAGLDPRAELDADLARLGVDRHRPQPLAHQVAHHLVAGGQVDLAAQQLAGGRARAVREYGHVRE
jgi:hypothetical protein